MSRTRSLSKLIGPSGSQAFDTNTLVIDAANNRVGIGTTSPAYKLDVNGAINYPSGTLNYTGTAVPAGANNQALYVPSYSIGLAGQWGSLNFPTTSSALTTTAWWMLGRSGGANDQFTLRVRRGETSGSDQTAYVVTTSGADSAKIVDNHKWYTGVSGGTERMTITGDGRLQINNYTVSAGAAISAKSAISGAGAMVLATQNYATTFGVLPWSYGQTYLSSGTHYSDTTWKADGANAGASLLKFGGEQGLTVFFGDGTADERYDTYVSDKQVISKYGLVVNNKQSYNSGYGTGAELASSSTSWQTLPWSGTGSTGERISTNVLKFDKIDNNSDLIISIHMPWYTSSAGSGFGLRLRTSVDGGSTVQNDILTDGPAHGWGSGGYGSVATSSIYNFTWNTESIISNTFVGEVRVYFEVKVWTATDSFYFVSYPGYYKHGFVHIEEVSRNHA